MHHLHHAVSAEADIARQCVHNHFTFTSNNDETKVQKKKKKNFEFLQVCYRPGFKGYPGPSTFGNILFISKPNFGWRDFTTVGDRQEKEEQEVLLHHQDRFSTTTTTGIFSKSYFLSSLARENDKKNTRNDVVLPLLELGIEDLLKRNNKRLV